MIEACDLLYINLKLSLEVNHLGQILRINRTTRYIIIDFIITLYHDNALTRYFYSIAETHFFLQVT